MNVRYRKVLRDVTNDLPKNLMLVLAIAVGVFGVGTILGGYAILEREMASNYLGTNPAAATIVVEEDSLTKEALNEVAAIQGVEEVERHATIAGRMKVGDDWRPMLLFVVDDFARMRTNKVRVLSGPSVPPNGTMFVERTALRVMRKTVGESLLVKTPDGAPTKIGISGIVHDPGLAPAWQEETGYGYLTLSTLQGGGESRGFDELRFTVPAHRRDADSVQAAARQMAGPLERRGYRIHEVQIPPPEKHPHQSQMNAVLMLFTAFAFLLLLLSAVLAATGVATLMVRQTRDIGIMKTIGARWFQVAGLYVVMIISLSLVAVALSAPLSRVAAVSFAEKIAILLNLEVGDRSIPGWVQVVQVASGILIPLFLTAIPVVRGSRLTARQAMDNYGATVDGSLQKSLLLRITRIRVVGETLALSMRNALRQRGRLRMALTLLAVGGATFMTALNVSNGWNASLKKIAEQRFYDIDLRLHRPEMNQNLERSLATVPGLSLVELWNYAPTAPVGDVSYRVVNTYPDKGHGSFLILGVPPATRLIRLPITSGRWLDSRDENDVVLNHMARVRFPSLDVGDSVSLLLENVTTRWRIVGFAEDLYSPATAYVPINAFRENAGVQGRSNMIRSTFDPSVRIPQDKISLAIEESLNRNNVSLYQSLPASLFRNAIAEHMTVLINSLLAMAGLIGIVGIIGLASTVSMNLLERTREIGVLKAMGAAPQIVQRIVIQEALMIGLSSVVFAFVLSILTSLALGTWIGNMAFRSPLPLTVSNAGLIIWVVIVVGGSVGAAWFPARRAGRLTTREALAYE